MASATAISELIQKYEACIAIRASHTSESELSKFRPEEVARVMEQVSPRGKRILCTVYREQDQPDTSSSK